MLRRGALGFDHRASLDEALSEDVDFVEAGAEESVQLLGGRSFGEVQRVIKTLETKVETP